MEMDISWSWFWFEEYIPSNLAGLPTRIATSFAHTTQRIIDSSHTLVASLTRYGPVLPANTASALDFDFDFDFWRSNQPPQPSPAPAPAPAPTPSTSHDSTNAAAAGTRQLLLATASTAALIALGITSVLIIPPPRTRLQAHYAGPLWLPYLPGDLHAHITALFSPSYVKTHPTAQQPRTEAVLVLGADTPLGRTIALHLATQGYVVLPVVASSAQAANTWAALTPPSSRGYIAPLLLPTLASSSSSRDEDLSHALAHFRSQLEATLTRRFPLTTAGEPYARPEEQVRLIAVINTLSCFLPSSSSSPPPNPPPSIHTSDTAPEEEDDDDDDTEESNTSTPADSVLLLNQNLTTTDTAALSDHLHKHVVAPLAAIEATLPIVRKHASPSKKKKNLTALILNLRAAPHSTTPTSSAHRTEGIIHAALDRALDSLRQECLALDRVERQGASSPHKLKEKKKKSDKRRSAGGEEEEQQQQQGSRPGVRTYRPGQFDARFFEEEKKEEEEEEEGEARKKEKQRSKNHRGSSSFHTTVPSVKIVDLQLSDWERVSSSPRGGGGASSPSASYTNQPPHPFQTRTTPASLLLLPPITDVVRLFGGGGGNPTASAVRNRGARCPQTIRLGLFAPTSSALGTTRVIGDRVVWIQGYLRSGLRALMDVGGGGGGAVFLVGIGTAVGKLWGSVLGLVGLGSVASSRGGRRTVGGGGGRRAGRREREREAGGAGRELVRRRGSPRSEDDDDEGEGYEIVTPTPSRVPGPSGSFHTTAPSTSSSATLGPSHDRSRSNTTTVNYGEMIPPRTAIRPSPFARQQSQSQSQIQQQQQQQREQGSSTSTSTPSSSPASSVRGMGGMVLPPAPSAGASPPVLPASHSHAPASTGPGSGSGSGAGGSGSGSGTPLSLSASVLELPSSVPGSSYDGGDGYDSFDEGSGSGLESLPSDFDLGSGVGSRVDVRDEGVEGEGEGRTSAAVERGSAGLGEGEGEGGEGDGDGVASASSANASGSAMLGDSWVAVSQSSSRSDVEGGGEGEGQEGQEAE